MMHLINAIKLTNNHRLLLMMHSIESKADQQNAKAHTRAYIELLTENCFSNIYNGCVTFSLFTFFSYFGAKLMAYSSLVHIL